jgi:hypothetical protein
MEMGIGDLVLLALLWYFTPLLSLPFVYMIRKGRGHPLWWLSFILSAAMLCATSAILLHVVYLRRSLIPHTNRHPTILEHVKHSPEIIIMGMVAGLVFICVIWVFWFTVTLRFAGVKVGFLKDS